MEHIPVVNVSKLSKQGPTSDSDLAVAAEDIFHALSGIGFAYLSNHGIDKNTIDNAFAVSKTFFELPQKVKDESLKDISKSHNGYAKPGQELLAPTSDLVGHEIRESYDLGGGGNLRFYPEACKEFGPALSELEEACKPLLKNLLRVLAVSLQLDKEYFVTRSKNLDKSDISSYTIFRSLYYPQIPDNIPPKTVRLAEHTDYGILTMLFQDDIGGLEVKAVNGKWVPATPIPGTILLNTGDLLEFWSGGKFPATCHKVLIPEAETKKKTHRQSIVFFVHPDDSTIVSPLTGNASEYEAVSAKEHAMKKLKSTYVY